MTTSTSPTSSGDRPRSRRRPSRPRDGEARRVAPVAPAADPAPVATAAAVTTPAVTSFRELGVPDVLVGRLEAQGITEAFPIQSATLPDSLAGRDVLGRGRTGSGKTLAFALPLVSRLLGSGRAVRAGRPRALVLLPTRELATQVHATIAPLAQAVGLRSTTVFGGVSQGAQVRALTAGVDVVVATPGRLEDLLRQGHLRLDEVEVTVLDEADHMADLGFLPAVRRILDLTGRGTQRLLFSATLDNGVDVLVRRYLDDPVTHSVDSDESTEPDMEHHVFTVAEREKASVVQELASGQRRSVLFTRTKSGAKRLARQLTQAGVPAVDLHGNLAQNARDRNLAAFRSGDVRVLVATDIAARGIHVDDVALVVHVDPPAEHKAYTHRSGRTARAGAAGVVVTVATDAQRSDVATLARRAGIRPQLARVSPGATAITALTGPPAPLVAPTAAPVGDAPGRQQRGGRGTSRGPASSGSRGAGSTRGSGSSSRGSGTAPSRTSGTGRSQASGTARPQGAGAAAPSAATSVAAFSERMGARRGGSR